MDPATTSGGSQRPDGIDQDDSGMYSAAITASSRRVGDSQPEQSNSSGATGTGVHHQTASLAPGLPHSVIHSATTTSSPEGNESARKQQCGDSSRSFNGPGVDRSNRELDVIMSSAAPSPMSYQKELFLSPAGTSNGRPQDAVLILKGFLDLLMQQLPFVSAAVDSLLNSARRGSTPVSPPILPDHRVFELQGLLLESQSNERRYSSEVVKAAAEVARIAELNALLSRDNESCRQELVAAQARAQVCLEETARLVQEIAVLREERERFSRPTSTTVDEELRTTRAAGELSHPGVAAALSPTAVTKASQQNNLSAYFPRSPLHTEGNTGGNSIGGNSNRSNFLSGFARDQPSSVAASGAALETDSATVGGSSSGPNGRDSSRTADHNGDRSALSSNDPDSGVAAAAPPPPQNNTNVGRKWFVTQVYKPTELATNDKFADLTEGEVVTIEREDTSGWWWVSTGNTSGWYPFSFLQELH